MNNFYTFVYPSLNFFFKFLIFFLPRFKAGKLSNQKKKKKKKKILNAMMKCFCAYNKKKKT